MMLEGQVGPIPGAPWAQKGVWIYSKCKGTSTWKTPCPRPYVPHAWHIVSVFVVGLKEAHAADGKGGSLEFLKLRACLSRQKEENSLREKGELTERGLGLSLGPLNQSAKGRREFSLLISASLGPSETSWPASKSQCQL